MKKYKVIFGKLEEVEETINKMTKEGWELIGGITSANKGSVIEYAQSLAKDIESIEPPVKKRRKKQ